MDSDKRPRIFCLHVFQRSRCLCSGACAVAGFSGSSDTRVHLVAKRSPECGRGCDGQRHRRLKYAIADLSPDAGPEVEEEWTAVPDGLRVLEPRFWPVMPKSVSRGPLIKAGRLLAVIA